MGKERREGGRKTTVSFIISYHRSYSWVIRGVGNRKLRDGNRDQDKTSKRHCQVVEMLLSHQYATGSNAIEPVACSGRRGQWREMMTLPEAGKRWQINVNCMSE